MSLCLPRNKVIFIFINYLLGVKLDLAFAVSGTDRSNNELFKKQVTFISQMLKNYRIHREQTLVTGILYGPTTKISFPFSTSQDVQLLKSYFEQMKNPGAATSMQQTLKIIANDVYSGDNGARQNVPKTLVLFVSGNVNMANFKENVDKIKKNSVNLIIVVIDGDGKPFRAFVDDPSKLFVFENIDDVDKLIDPVVVKSLPGKYSISLKCLLCRNSNTIS